MALFQYSGAVGLLRSGLYEEAVPEYSIVIRMLPDFALAYYGRGVAYMRQERPAYSLALEDLNSAIELDPGMANAYRERAEWHVRQGDLESAKADLETAIPLYDQQRQGNDLLAALIMQQQLAEGQISGFGESESESTPVPAP
jgi:tetratricopeptide (TPR) repeat protein